jgi:hypothetical protein
MMMRKLALGGAGFVLAMIAAPPVFAQGEIEAREEATPDAIVAIDQDAPESVVVLKDTPADQVVIVQKNSADQVVVVRNPDGGVTVVDESSETPADQLIAPDVPIPLWRVENVVANREFFNAPVLDVYDLPVGHFRRIEVRDDGREMAVITLNNSRRTISLPVEFLRVDPDDKRMIATLTWKEINMIPSGVNVPDLYHPYGIPVG